MDHMRISGTEPSLVILSKTMKVCKDPKSILMVYDQTILKGKRNAYSLWIIFVSKIYCLCK